MFSTQLGKYLVSSASDSLKHKWRWSVFRKYAVFPYLVLLGAELAAVNNASDLPIAIGNWIPKATQIASFQVPDDNFYGPGAALLLVPFLWLSDKLFFVILFYFLMGSFAFWKITGSIASTNGRIIARSALPLNFYLIWLINSSQDTVFEFFLIMWAIYFLLNSHYLSFSSLTFLLVLTRAGYWTFFLGTSLLLFFYDLIKKRKLNLKKMAAVPLLIFISTFNYVNFQSLSPALEGGVTSYFSYSKYHYLALPKMDMDVFLSGRSGIFQESIDVKMDPSMSGADSNSKFQKMAIDSLSKNKKETLLGWMQKIDSYFFIVQKVPNLPGSYVLDIQNKRIEIQDERLTWRLVIGHFLFFIYRLLLVCAGLLAAGLLLAQKLYRGEVHSVIGRLWVLSLPYLFGVIPGVIFYTETRFKIVSELLLVPLIVKIWSSILSTRFSKSN